MAIALVTGASSGIGSDIAWEFAKNGYSLVLSARRLDRLQALKKEIEDKYAVRVWTVTADLATQRGPSELYESVRKLSVDVDILVNNAGFGAKGSFTELSWDVQEKMILLNMYALTELCHLFLRDMKKRNSGRILNVASTAAFQPGPFMAVYYATKAYVLSLGQALSHELLDTGITVTTLCPGPTATEFAEVAGAKKTVLFSMIRPATSKRVAEVGVRACLKGKRRVIDGWINWILATLAPLIPKPLILRVAAYLQK